MDGWVCKYMMVTFDSGLSFRFYTGTYLGYKMLLTSLTVFIFVHSGWALPINYIST